MAKSSTLQFGLEPMEPVDLLWLEVIAANWIIAQAFDDPWIVPTITEGIHAAHFDCLAGVFDFLRRSWLPQKVRVRVVVVEFGEKFRRQAFRGAAGQTFTSCIKRPWRVLFEALTHIFLNVLDAEIGPPVSRT